MAATITARQQQTSRFSVGVIPCTRLLPLTATEALFQRFQGREWFCAGIVGLYRREFGTRLARIGIDTEKQELHSDRAQVQTTV